MQLHQAATLIASTVFFLPTNNVNVNVNASLLRGIEIDGKFEFGDTIEITEDRPGTFLIVSLSVILIQFIVFQVVCHLHLQLSLCIVSHAG